MNIFSNMRYWYVRKILPGFKLAKNDLVVDIGSGDKPFWRGDVFVDKLSLGNVQRATDSKTVDTLGIFVNSDVEDMPFKNNSFDFSYCSHLLEHVEDPGKVIKEIARISRRGYIEVPNGILETIKPFESHLWFVYKKKESLVFVRKSKYIHKLLSENGVNYDKLLGKVEEPFIRFYWSKNIKYEIYDNYKKRDKFLAEKNQSGYGQTQNINPYIVVTKVLRIMFYKKKNKEKIRSNFK